MLSANEIESIALAENINPDIVMSFGLIVYTAENPGVSKMLANEHFLDGLRAASGDHFVVFAIKPGNNTTSFPKRIRTAKVGLLVQIIEYFFKKTNLVGLPGDPNDGAIYMKDLGIPKKAKLPQLVLITHFEGELDRYNLRLSKSPDENVVYEELSNILSKISNYLESIEGQRHQVEFVRNNLRAVLFSYNGLRITTNIVNAAQRIVGFFRSMLP